MKTSPCFLRLRQTRVFTALLVSFMILVTPVMPLASASVSSARIRPAGEYLPAGAFAPSTAIIGATKTDSFPDPNGDGKAEPGETITYDVNVSNAGASDATGVTFSDTIDPNTTLVPGSLRVSPLAFGDTYSASKDVALSIPAPGVLGNDTGTPQPTAQLIGGGATTQGGTVTLNSDGSFSYTPPNGFQGADTFSYKATNGFSPDDTATVTINVDDGPAVTTTSPAGGATSVAQNTNITINFTEPVNATTGSFSVECPAGSPQTFTLSASPAASFTLDPSADLPAGTTCKVTVFANQITDADTFDPPDQMAADYTFSFGVRPLAVDDMRSATGNVRINTASSGYSVLANDQAPGASVTAFDATSVRGGNVTMNTTTGTFTYDPPRGFTGTDSFNYTIGNAAGSDQGTVVLTVTDMLWFINNGAGACSAACDGRLSHPFPTLAAFEAINGNGTTAGGVVIDPEAGDNIFLYTGGGNYAGPVTLENNQRFIGQGAPSSIQAITGITFAPDSDLLPATGGTAPVITTTGVAVSGIILAQNDQLHGLRLVNTTGTSIRNATGASVGTLLLDTVSVSNTTTAAGISLTAGGTVAATGVNTISTNTGTALNVTNTNIDAAGMTFRSISSGTSTNSAPNGIILNNTGTLGGLTVTGTGTPGSGGTIANKTGANGSTTQGTGIYLNNTSGVSLSWMQLNGFQNYAIFGSSVTGFSLANSVISGTNGNNNLTGAEEGAIRFNNLLKNGSFAAAQTAQITNSSISGGASENVRVMQTSGTLDRLNITNNTFGLISSTLGNDNFHMEATGGGTVAKVTLTGNTFGGTRGDFIETIANTNSTMDAVVRQNKFNDGQAIVSGGGTAVSIRGDSPGSAANVTFDISCNRMNGGTANSYDTAGVFVDKGAGNGTFNGTIVNNIIGPGRPDNFADGLFVRAAGGGTLTTLIQNNQLTGWGNVGIHLQNNSGSSTMNASIFGNSVSSQEAFPLAALFADNGATTTDTSTMNLVVGSATNSALQNTLAVGPNGYIDVFLANFTASTTFNLSKNGSASTTEAGVFDDDNVGSPSVDPAGGSGPINLVNTLPLAPAAPASCSVVAALTSPVTTDAPEEVAASTESPRVWSDMPATSVTAAYEPENDSAVYIGALGAAQRPARMVKASYEPSGRRDTRTATRKRAKAVSYAAPVAAPALSGETVNASIGTLPAGKSVRITFQVTVNNPFGGTNKVSNQGTVSGSNFASVLTDDPAAGGSADPTVTPILTPPTIAIKDASVAEPATGTAPAAFAVTLSHAYTHTVTVNYATADDAGGANPAAAGSDYTATSGTLTFNPGETVQTISVPVLADADATETNETFIVNISGATAGSSITDSQAIGTIAPESTPGTLVISELRTSGPAGPDDEFVELLNNTDNDIIVQASDSSAGWALVKSNNGCSATPVVVAVIPNGTVIRARGNYLVVGSAYSLGTYAAGDQALVFNIEDDRNIALFNTADLSNISTAARLDAVGFGSNAGGNCDLLREGSTLQPAQGSTSEYSFVRKVDKGATQDTNDNAADFIVVSTTATTPVGSNNTPTLGAPGPENSTGARGPVPCNVPGTARFDRSRLDSTLAVGSAPNTVRDTTADPANNSTYGTIDFRRRFTNHTGGAVTRLRFRITNTTNPATTGAADLRARSSAPLAVSVNDPATCGGSTPCSVTVQGTTLEQPPTQASGGGINSTLGVGTITLGTPLADGASVNLHLLFGVQQTGNYHVSIVIETETAGQIGQDVWELRGHTETGGHSDGGCNTPPVAKAGDDQTIECGGESTPVALDGSASTDADGDSLTYEWREGTSVLGTEATLNTSLSFGPHTITLKVTDPSGDFNEDTVNVNIVDTTDPMITAPPNVSVNTGPGATSCGAFVSDETLGSPTASDGCSASVTVTRTGVPADNVFPVGTTIITYKADDGHGHTKKAYQSVTVTDNTKPTISAPPNKEVNAPANSCSVNLDPGTATANDNCPGVTVEGVRSDSQLLNAPYPVGTTTITWTATDAHGNTASVTQTIKVNDVTPPTITLTSGMINLAPPNHQYQTFSIANFVASVSDSCDSSVDINDVVISGATSDEPENAVGNGDGNTLNDIVIAPDCKSLQLRSERDGNGDGRVYTITLQVKDSSGNVATAVRKVFVPRIGPAIDNGVQYTVNGCSP